MASSLRTNLGLSVVPKTSGLAPARVAWLRERAFRHVVKRAIPGFPVVAAITAVLALLTPVGVDHPWLAVGYVACQALLAASRFWVAGRADAWYPRAPRAVELLFYIGAVANAALWSLFFVGVVAEYGLGVTGFVALLATAALLTTSTATYAPFPFHLLTLLGVYLSGTLWALSGIDGGAGLVILAFSLIYFVYLLLHALAAHRHFWDGLAAAELLEHQAQELQASLDRMSAAGAAARAAAETKTVFLRNVGHELRTPLNAIVGAAELLDGPGLTERQRAFVRAIADGGKTLRHHLERIMELAALDDSAVAGEMVSVDLRSFIRDCVAEHSASAVAKGVELVLDDAGLAEGGFSIDRRRARRVIEIFLDNAVKFTYLGSVRVTAFLRAEQLVVRIVDTGVGMTDDLIDRCGGQFAQGEHSEARRHGGLGIGIAIAIAHLDAMGGGHLIRSTPGVGTEVEIAVPVVAAR